MSHFFLIPLVIKTLLAYSENILHGEYGAAIYVDNMAIYLLDQVSQTATYSNPWQCESAASFHMSWVPAFGELKKHATT